ncbi:MAG: hypothetical protein KAR06_01565 [Deltaproteobacteria bacterium]|nr:hypothetical protein [Deltaproteobacteria bacterium]
MKRVLLTLSALLIATNANAHTLSQAEQTTASAGGPLQWIIASISHTVSGIDHLLILLAAVVILTKYKGIVALVTASKKNKTEK